MCLCDTTHSLPPITSQVEVTKFEDLEETHAEVKMKQNLWDSQRDWQKDYQRWMTVQLQYCGRCGTVQVMEIRATYM